jgi:predicted nucleotidyltransferase
MAYFNRHKGLTEGDYVETLEGLLFTVKGIHHPEGLTIAYLRYIPDPEGERERRGQRYRRIYDLKETDSFLRDNHPQYLNLIEDHGLTLQSIPHGRIAKTYKPRKRLQEILADPKHGPEQVTARLASALTGHCVPPGSLGVSGSVLIGLATPNSDVDLIVYGFQAGRRVYEALERLRKSVECISPLGPESVVEVTRSRWGDTGLDLGGLAAIEARKILHGLVDGTDYFVRLVRGPEELEREVTSRPLGKVTLRATVKNDRASIFTPCTYEIEECSYLGSHGWPEPSELASYRGKFTEQAGEGERVEVRGTLERVDYGDRTTQRVMLGGRGDYLVPLYILDR